MTCRHQKRVLQSVALSEHRYFVQNLNKGDRVTFPPGCTLTGEPEMLTENIFHHYEFMGTRFDKLPFAFAVDHHRQMDIQKILNFSFKQQKVEDVSYSPGFVCRVIKACMDALTVPCIMEMGYRRMDKEGKNHHIWLKIDNIIIDNTYEKYMTESQIAALEKTTPKCYTKDNIIFYPDEIPTDKDEFAKICYQHNIEIFGKEPDKGMVLSLNQEQLYHYYFAMIRFMWDTFGLNITAINGSIRHCCWGCGKFPPHSAELLSDIITDDYTEVTDESCKFKHCGLCMVATYCSIECQRYDWEKQHRFVCVSRVSGSSSDWD